MVSVENKGEEEDDIGPQAPSRHKAIQDQLQAELDRVVAEVDENGDGLMSTAELKEALEAHPELKEKLNVLAVNIALFDDDRIGNSKEAQERVDAIVEALDQDGDGMLNLEELKAANSSVKRRISTEFGININV
eukprot:NODE_11_length_2857_cov_225.710826_g9_i0.p3 GENE.NODE_11_length_2857_cov_225.710826_g9_i0~~NODE_11_length_2857_cov_225.710826_g9_i0.p3  ORF type:complete len:134 (+),score=49.09 NODE_11_length_2857_cov_225.710826_g9_i0:85-486(+)